MVYVSKLACSVVGLGSVLIFVCPSLILSLFLQPFCPIPIVKDFSVTSPSLRTRALELVSTLTKCEKKRESYVYKAHVYKVNRVSSSILWEPHYPGSRSPLTFPRENVTSFRSSISTVAEEILRNSYYQLRCVRFCFHNSAQSWWLG